MNNPIAITRIALATGFGDDTEETWRRVLDGESAVRATDRFSGAQVSQLDGDDVLRRLAGRIAGRDLPGNTGVVIGTNGAAEEAWLTGKPYAAPDAVAGMLGIRGPRMVFGTGCIAGTNAFCYAVDVLRSGQADAMVVVGVDLLTLTTMATFSSWRALDPAPTRPYAHSGGVNLGEGAAMVLLETQPREEDVIAYVRGYGLTADAFHVTSPPPDGDGLLRAMRIALEDAGVTPDAVDYVNGHGTGTPANDTAELAALRSLFGTEAPPVSSSKPQVGHTLGAAGVVEVALTALAIRDQVLPPTGNVGAVDAAALDWDIVPNRSREARIDLAMSNSLAFGGANGVVVLGRAPGTSVAGSGDRQVESRGTATVTDLDEAWLLTPPAYRGRLDELGLLTMAAGQAAWRDAGDTAPDPARVGVVLVTAGGPVATMEELHTARERNELHLVSPVTAPNVVSSVTAGYFSQALGLKGPLSAITSGPSATERDAVEYATGLIRQGRADGMVVIAADEDATGASARVLVGGSSCTS
ncbi:beta-ketoacyl-[acyl-carrier-protein] synthase family protein [Streptomyces sp. NBC_00178]|uniref:beta-ketoacyl-[acyl-carrier-protein] synthase family protein n=1 Tax=Streptomyces sp. NBC_00178 TaxID=2975672 RepID=UPI002E290275|nr:beta-ketoacyl-[acyl-carrier-protein] synthase family protein [Streptomyces sp. NBC_00178]